MRMGLGACDRQCLFHVSPPHFDSIGTKLRLTTLDASNTRAAHVARLLALKEMKENAKRT